MHQPLLEQSSPVRPTFAQTFVESTDSGESGGRLASAPIISRQASEAGHDEDKGRKDAACMTLLQPSIASPRATVKTSAAMCLLMAGIYAVIEIGDARASKDSTPVFVVVLDDAGI